MVCPRQPEWLNRNVKNMLRKQNKIYKKYKRNGYKNEDKVIMDRLRNECFVAIESVKEKCLRDLGKRLADPTTGQNIYWKILKKYLSECKFIEFHL